MSNNNNNINNFGLLTEEENALCSPNTLFLFAGDANINNFGAEDSITNDVLGNNTPLTVLTNNGNSLNSSVSTRIPIEDMSVEMMIEELMQEKQELFKGYCFHRRNKNFVDSEKALAEMQSADEEIETLRSMSSEKISSSTTSSVQQQVEKPRVQQKGKFEGLALSRSDIPKFRLVSTQFPLDGRVDVFESDLQFINTFERVIASSSWDLESSWHKLFPLCFDYHHTAWVNNELKNCTTWKDAKKAFHRQFGSKSCTTWKDAKEAFHKQFGSKNSTMDHVHKIWTMTMEHKESISGYTQRFAEQVYLAQMTDEKNAANLAQRFLASLLPGIQTVVKLALHIGGEDVERTFEDIAQIARNILGDDYKSYSAAIALFPGAQGASSQSSDDASSAHGVKRASSSQSAPSDEHKSRRTRRYQEKGSKPEKNLYCTHHGKDDTHVTEDCKSIKRRQEYASTSSSNPCRRCGTLNWSRSHRCPPRVRQKKRV